MNRFPIEYKKGVSDRQIIIIDDDDRYRFALKRKLSLHGFANLRLEKTPPSAEAIGENDVNDLVLLDIHLDENGATDGIAALAAYRQGGVASYIVMVSGDESPSTFVESVRHGADDYWIKGIRLDLAHEINALFFRQRRRSEKEMLPVDVTTLGYLRTLDLSSEEIEALAFSAKQMMSLGQPSPESPLFENKPQLWRMVHQIFEALMVRG